MGLLKDWGFTASSWQGQRGEYWVLMQALLLLGFAVLPAYKLSLRHPLALQLAWGLAGIAAGFAVVLIVSSVLGLGSNLTPLPHPRDDGQLVQTGIYTIVRHPLYSGLIFAALSWALLQVSLSHLIGTIVCFGFFNAKANREERWLTEKFPDYSAYQKRVKKLLPWIY